MITIITLETKLAFLFEKRTEMYIRYIEESIAKEKANLVQEPLQSFVLCTKAGKGGVLL